MAITRRNTDEYENWLNSSEGEYPYHGEGMQSGIKPRDLVQMLRAQKARTAAKTGNAPASGFDMIRRRS